MPNPKATFEELLKKNNAVANLTFTQFCEWACDEHLNQYSDSNSYDDWLITSLNLHHNQNYIDHWFFNN